MSRRRPLSLDAPDRTVLNVNVPDVTEAQLRGLRRATLATFGAVQTHVTEVNEGYVEVSYRDVDRVREPGTDTALLAEGWATFTPLHSVCEALSVETGSLESVG